MKCLAPWLLLILAQISGCDADPETGPGPFPGDCPLTTWYFDGDGDGWGADAEETRCESDPAEGFTARTARDCDDEDPHVTGRTGVLCPDQLLTGIGDGIRGMAFADREFVWGFGSQTPLVRASAGVSACRGWGSPESPGEAPTFESQSQASAFQGGIDESLAGANGSHATFLGIAWVGDLDDGQWSWVGPGDDALIGVSALGWCDAPVRPADFFPLLNPDNPDHRQVMEDQLVDLRLAMVRRDDLDWCLGVPTDAIPPDIAEALDAGTADLQDPFVADVARYSTLEAQVSCGRPAPRPTDYY